MRVSAVLIIPADLKPQADAIGQAMGWGGESYTIPLPDAEAPTHYGLRADVAESFVRWIKGIDPLPEGVADAAAPVMAALIHDFSPDPTVEYGEDDTPPPTVWGRAHFDAVVEREGLWPVETEAD